MSNFKLGDFTRFAWFTQNIFVRWVLFLLLAYFTGWLLIERSHQWTILGRGILTFNPKIYYYELPLFSLFCGLFFFSKVNNAFVRYFFPLLPATILYLLFDQFFNYFQRSPTLSDYQNFNTISHFSFLMLAGLVLIYSLIPLVLGLMIWLSIKKTGWLASRLWLGTRAILFLALMWLLPSSIFYQFQQLWYQDVVWSQEDAIRENGRFSSFLFFSNQQRANQRQLLDYRNSSKPVSAKDTLFTGHLSRPVNIHMIVLESFIDPRLIESKTLPKTILAQELLRFLGPKKDFSKVVSPIYGGGTAQAEFELLTGVPALALVNQIEFNVMKGGPIGSFVAKLNEENYATRATIAPDSIFFNSRRAYKSMGFSQIEYLESNSNIPRLPDDGPIFDGDLLTHNLQIIKDYMAHSKKPLFNYVLGMYGHLPFGRDKQKRPDVYHEPSITLLTQMNVTKDTDKVSDKHQNLADKQSKFSRIANQFYYRTKALADYLNKLSKIDPDAMVIITADHLPSILNDQLKYHLDHKQNIALMMDAGEFVDISGQAMYQLPSLVWQRLAESPIRAVEQTIPWKTLYFSLLAESLVEIRHK